MTPEKIQALGHKYHDFAEAHGAATQRGDYKAANKSYAKLVEVLLGIRTHGKDGEASLVRLSRDPNDAVACWAATHSLPFAESNALDVLKALSTRAGPMGFSAQMVIQEWMKGQLVIP